MPSVQGYGAIPGGGNVGQFGDTLVKMLESGILGNNDYKKQQEDKKNNNDEIIKAGISSKTMRPSKDGEKSDFTDSSGRGWTYDDSGLKEQHEQLENQRKDAHWITINSNVEKELQAKINASDPTVATPEQQTMFRNQRIAQYLGVGADGKMSPGAKDDLSPEGQAWVDSMAQGSKGEVNRTPADANLPHPFLAGNPGAFEALSGLFGKMGTGFNNMMGANQPGATQSFMGGHGAGPQAPAPQNPDIQAILSLMAMRGQQPPAMGPGVPQTNNLTLGQPGG